MSAASPAVRRRRRVVAAVVVVLLVLLAVVGYRVLQSRSGGGTTTIGACTVALEPSSDRATHCPGVDWAGVRVTDGDLRFADLAGADLAGADLTNTILFGADLTGADLRGADLTGADLTGTKLVDAQLEGADITGTYITGMDVTGTVLAAANQDAWTTVDQLPVRVDLQSETLAGVVTNTCADRAQLYYPGLVSAPCTLSTGTRDGQTMQYGVTVRVLVAPVVDAPAEVSAVVGQPLTVPVSATSPFPFVNLTTFDTPLPDGLRWDAATQQITGTPTAAAVGVHVLAFRAENGRRADATITMTVTDPAAAVPTAPVG